LTDVLRKSIALELIVFLLGRTVTAQRRFLHEIIERHSPIAVDTLSRRVIFILQLWILAETLDCRIV
jgi:hypothetical protein